MKNKINYNETSSIFFHKHSKQFCWHEFSIPFRNHFRFMNEDILFASQDSSIPDTNERFSQYLSFRFYRENLDSIKDKTKDSINNFLKTISEIEDEFVSMLQNQGPQSMEFSDYGFDTAAAYMEENY